MKQYDLTMFFDDFERPTVIVGEKPHGRYVRAADIQAWALKLKEVVEGMEHERSCPVLFCQRCFVARTEYEHWAFVGDAHDFEPGEGTCRKCEALRLLGEVLG